MKKFFHPKKIALLMGLAISLTLAGCGENAQKQDENKIVKLYYYNAEKDKDKDGNILCSAQGLQAVSRKISKTEKPDSPLSKTLQLLLKGELTSEEKSQGITTEFPLEKLMLDQVKEENGVVTLTFSDPLNKTSGGSCRVAILLAQIKATAMQFETVKEVHFAPEELFQP